MLNRPTTNLLKFNKLDFKKKYHYLLLGLAFILLDVDMISNCYDYFIRKRFFEGFMVVGDIIVFDILTLPVGIIFMFKKDFRRLGQASIIYVLLHLFGFLGFHISLTVLPFIITFGSFFFFYQFLTVKTDNLSNPEIEQG